MGPFPTYVRGKSYKMDPTNFSVIEREPVNRTIERTLQQEVMLRLKSYRVLAVPSANGIFMPARTQDEKRAVARVMAQMKRLGQLTPGAPDIIVLWRDGAGLIELKRSKMVDLLGNVIPAGRPTALQQDMAAYARDLGINHAFCHSWEEVREALITWGAPMS